MNTGKRRRRRVVFAAAILIAVIGITLYSLADRYLIEHVEGVVTNEQADPDKADATTGEAEYDDWNYSSDDIDIHIDKVEAGSGAGKITYYVADVKLESSSDLQSAFAKNAFGRNIIEDTSKIASDHQAIFAINGDYYGFRSDGVIIRNGTVYRDVPARTGLALFRDGTMESYDEQQLSSGSLLARGVAQTFSFGPALVENGQAVGDFASVKIDSNFGNRSIQDSNPRTGIGLVAPNHYKFVVVDGRMANYSKGLTLSEFAKLFADLGCTDAYNLDGGGSSTMYFMGRVVNNPLGKQDERGVSDIIYIGRGDGK
ncbi:phosphodiester glycosidase family protein [Paenibacillus hemerocallicola]|uniref:Phosphodiester glycosidase family protein n=1 Tax=Paenibacillus hemerocallicola TaxID=1172614 RepID=A0A5C4T042_9BACL|nr:phosphodiester glycosidase family protein [Paenibacillus hemerocallicola]